MESDLETNSVGMLARILSAVDSWEVDGNVYHCSAAGSRLRLTWTHPTIVDPHLHPSVAAAVGGEQ